MSVQRLGYRPIFAALCGIILGAAACADSPTGIPDEPSSQRLHAQGDAGSEQICYLIDGQRYCVSSTPTTARDSTDARP